MHILGVAIWIKTNDEYLGTCTNVTNGEVFVGMDTATSMEHYMLQKIIYKTHRDFPDELPNATFGYLVKDEDGVKFVNRVEAGKADNLKPTGQLDVKKIGGIYSYNVVFDDNLSVEYKKETDCMKAMLTSKYKIQDIPEMFY